MIQPTIGRLALALFALLVLPLALLADSKEELERRAAAQASELAARIESHGAADSEVQEIRIRLGHTLKGLALPKKALEYYLPAEKELSRTLSPADTSLARLRSTIADAWDAAGKREEGVKFLEKRVRALPSPEDRNTPELRIEFAETMEAYGAALHGLESYELGLAMYGDARTIRREVQGEEHVDTDYATHGWCACAIELGRLQEAREPLEKILARALERSAPKPFIQLVRNNLAYLYQELDEHGKALAIFDAIIAELDQDSAPADNSTRLLAAGNRVYLLAELGRLAEAIAEAEKLLATYESLTPKSAWKDDIDQLEKARREWRKTAAAAEKGEKGEKDTAEPATPPAGS